MQKITVFQQKNNKNLINFNNFAKKFYCVIKDD